MTIEKGYELEKKIEKFFQLNGYMTKRNVSLEGKSGGKHEVDILAEKSDGITTFRMMVECKAWDKPIEKDVVSKASYVARDLGLNKAIIVSLGGWRIGAEKSANELGIELWGNNEIEQKLGKVAIAELETIEFKKVVEGLPMLVEEEQISPTVERESRGTFGFGKEEIVWIKSIWLPCYLFQISYSKKEGFIKKTTTTTKVWNIYEAVGGNWFAGYESKPATKGVEATNIIQPRVKDSEIKREIAKTWSKYCEVVTSSAIARYGKKLRALGIPQDARTISIDFITEIFYPFYAALLIKDDKERIIAVDGTTGELSKVVGHIFTANLSYVVEALRQDNEARSVSVT